MFEFLKKIPDERKLKKFQEIVVEINSLEEEIEAFSNDELRKESEALRERVRQGLSLDDALPRAFAFVREAARRTLKQRTFDVQCMGGIALHEGAVAEMVTGEGKTLSAVSPVYLHALEGNGVHVVTVNEYLARRDAVWMGQIYRALGLSVACLVPNEAYLYDPLYKGEGGDESKLLDKERDTTGSYLVQQEYLRPISRREAYHADITYGTNHEFGFDFLRDNLAYDLTQQVQRGHHYAVIDEVDSILIDEARTPLIIAVPDERSSEFYKTFARVVEHLRAEEDYTVDEKLRSAAITDAGIEKVEKMIGIQDLYSPTNMRLIHFLEESLRAHALYRRDKDYVVKEGEVIIVDEFTGRMLHGRRYNAGLHQAIEAKEGVYVKDESRTYAKISIQNYFRMYKKLAGMTGTAKTSSEEFYKVYNMEVISIPTNRLLIRKDLPDAIYRTIDAKYRAVVKEVKDRHDKGQPILLGTASIEKNELVSGYLSDAGIPHEVLNAKNNEREGAIIAQAGRKGAVTVATNVAGRGVDIILGGNPQIPDEAEKVRELGGLHVIGTERHEARRIDNQLRGRAGRQGDQGSSQFFLSLEDDLLRIFGGERIEGIMKRFDFPEDQPSEVGMVSKAVEQAQAKVEGANFDLRKHLLEYDDVLNKQRSAVYARREKILQSFNKDEFGGLVFDAASVFLEKSLQRVQGDNSSPFTSENFPHIKKLFEDAAIVSPGTEWPWKEAWPHELSDEEIQKEIRAIITKRSVEAALSPGALQRLVGILDMLWMNHLESLDALNEAIGLRAYSQKDPLVEYRRESHRLFQDFWDNFNAWVFLNFFRLSLDAEKSTARGVIHMGSSQRAPSGKEVGRNDPCPCGAKHEDGRPKKYKHCHGT